MTPYLHFEGTCEAALAHYASALGGRVEIAMRHGDAPPEVRAADAYAGLVMHAILWDGDRAVLMASDSAGEPLPAGGRISLGIEYAGAERAAAVFAALADGGAVTMPMQPVFWGGSFGTVTDRYGVPWMVSSLA